MTDHEERKTHGHAPFKGVVNQATLRQGYRYYRTGNRPEGVTLEDLTAILESIATHLFQGNPDGAAAALRREWGNVVARRLKHPLGLSWDEKMEMPLAGILSVRTYRMLDEREIFTVRQLLGTRPEVLMTIPNFGYKTLVECADALLEIGIINGEEYHQLCSYSL